jgi:putative phosphoribosyl transferase
MREVARTVAIPAAGGVLPGDLVVPDGAPGVVLFAHGSGSSRRSVRNGRVAAAIREGLLATLLFDLLTEPEARDRRNVFDVPLLASRLAAATAWVRAQRPDLVVGTFGASTGAAAALLAAADDPDVAAVVSRGGRPDLAGPRLAEVRAPTLLLVGGDDEPVLSWNREAFARLRCPKALVVVPGATHLFEEPGALDRVAAEARAWFVRHLAGPPYARPP